ncbi:MAG TPA: T9SS type A sorting domain-containing protein [Candidatus Kapabacteria bacterium]|nr:T9SS type A sorting domain-containing protein [Candidatus Kapabacteria bacterium]
MHHAPRILFIAALLLLIRAVPSFAQGKASSADASKKIHDWIKHELASNPNKKKLAQVCDSYERRLLLEASAALKIPLSDLAGEPMDEIMEASQPADTGVSLNVSKNPSRCQNETSIAICRTNPAIIIAGANDARTFLDAKGQPVFVTTNSGKTWATVFIPVHANYTSAGDPVLVSGPDGKLYYAYLLSAVDGTSNIIVASSTDGRIWKNGNPVAKDAPPDGIRYIEDKEQMCVDQNPASPHYGRLYLVWIRFEIDETVFEITAQTLRVTFSDDNGKTWSTPTIIAEGACQFSSIHTGKNGELFISFSLQLPNEHHLYTSTDGGNSFTPHTVGTFTDYPPNVDGRDALKGDFGFRCFPYTSFDVDQKTNKIYFVYGDYYSETEAALHYLTSTDLGATWKPEHLIGYGTSSPELGDPHDRFCPWVTFNQKTGDALLTYYSSERTDDNLEISAFRTRLNGPVTESPKPLELTDFDPTTMQFVAGQSETAFIGDYIGSDVTDTVYAAAWARSNGSATDGEVYVYVGMPNHPASAVGPSIVKSDRLRLASVFPNPSTGTDIHFNYYAPEATHASLVLYSTDGKKVATIWNGELIEGSSIETASLKNIAAGAYILSLETSEARDEIKVVVK